MTDKEILELVAKAVGGTFSPGTCRHRIGPTWDEWEWIGPMGISMPNGLVIYPLTNGGDALQLAVMYHFRISIENYSTRIFPQWEDEQVAAVAFEKCTSELEATCRAICLAIAVIGESLP